MPAESLEPPASGGSPKVQGAKVRKMPELRAGTSPEPYASIRSRSLREAEANARVGLLREPLSAHR